LLLSFRSNETFQACLGKNYKERVLTLYFATCALCLTMTRWLSTCYCRTPTCDRLFLFLSAKNMYSGVKKAGEKESRSFFTKRYMMIQS
jgi:hypothetical protein